MHVGIDLDNTIICYDNVFHHVARKNGWVDATCPSIKTRVKDAVLASRDNDVWTELQGLVYGEFLPEAEPYQGALPFITECRTRNWSVSVISHKTQFPAVGDKVDLRVCARNWLAERGIASQLRGLTFCDTRAEKVAQIARQGCDLFIDDLPEVFRETGFPANTQRLLFDPANDDNEDRSWTHCVSWDAIRDHVFAGEVPAQ